MRERNEELFSQYGIQFFRCSGIVRLLMGPKTVVVVANGLSPSWCNYDFLEQEDLFSSRQIQLLASLKHQDNIALHVFHLYGVHRQLDS